MEPSDDDDGIPMQKDELALLRDRVLALEATLTYVATQLENPDLLSADHVKALVACCEEALRNDGPHW